ncbi:MAG: DUF4296 domain-containing protein [Flavobacteriaceae bacterium]|jgi:hypothetical protein|nr:DUF4296 domain-containing protein [Flavobacteriaceae bacterium]
MKKLFLLLTITLLLYSCNKNEDKPSPFIEEDKMENILYDVAILYGMQSTYGGGTSDTIKQIDMKSIFKKYDIDSITFTKNNRYYVGLDNLIYFKMQNRIMKRLEEQRNAVDTLLSKENKAKVEQLEAVKPLIRKRLLLQDSISKG